MKDFDIVAYAIDGALFCPDCAVKLAREKGLDLKDPDSERVKPAFTSEEPDDLESCAGCGEILDLSYDNSAVNNVARRVFEYLVLGRGDPVYLLDAVDYLLFDWGSELAEHLFSVACDYLRAKREEVKE